MGLNVGILGGSIAGCAVAAELARAGCTVTVLEGGSGGPHDRGGGIGLPPSLVATLVERDLVDAALPRLEVHRFPRVVRDEDEERRGRAIWEQPGRIAILSWAALQRSLRHRVPEGAYHAGCQATAVRESGAGSVIVELENARTREFDLVVCADGYRSLGRPTLFPGNPVTYAGYVLWRGAVEERALSEVSPLEGAVSWASYAGGYGPFFLVPGPDGSVEAGRRLASWGLYLSVAEVERAELLTGKNPPAYDGPLAAAREARLKSWVPDVLPKLYAEIVTKSAGTCVQTIHECTVPAYRKGRVCLAGDAGALARPHTGTGVLKGIEDAIALGDALRAPGGLDDALERWSRERTTRGNELVELGAQIGRALAAEVRGATPDAAAAHFESIVTLPSEVFAP